MDYLIDTNVLLRSIHRGHPAFGLARAVFHELADREQQIVVATQTFVEFWAVCTRPIEQNGLGLSAEHTNRIVTRLEAKLRRLPESDEIYGEWRRLVASHSVSGKKVHDARLVAAMRVHGVQDIVTFNTADSDRYSEIRVHSQQRLIASFTDPTS
jgi:predicted nucleic acid-binding protein